MARAAVIAVAGICGLLPLALTRPPQATSVLTKDAPQATSAINEAHVRTACGVCHAFPPPDVLPRYAWRDEIVRMMYIRENRLPPIGAEARDTVQLPADFQQALEYYL